MEHTLTSEGKCIFCEQLFSQKTIAKHLASHLSKTEKEDDTINSKTYCHIEVEDGVMFLHLLVKGSLPLKKIDAFLRDIWLECCGHMSNFGHKDFKIAMTHKVEEVFATKVKIYHNYDYGDTTQVFLKGIKNYNLKLSENIILLSRNQPLKLICAKCEKHPAQDICITCDWDFYCQECSLQHEKDCSDFGDYAKMPVVNSPRMGVCGYTGGRIDKKRDGVHQ